MFSESSPPLPWDIENNYTRKDVELYYEVSRAFCGIMIRSNFTGFGRYVSIFLLVSKASSFKAVISICVTANITVCDGSVIYWMLLPLAATLRDFLAIAKIRSLRTAFPRRENYRGCINSKTPLCVLP